MRIKWTNLLALVLIAAAAIIATKTHRQIGEVLTSVTRIGPLNSAEERTMGLLALGLILVALVATVRLLTHGEHADR